MHRLALVLRRVHAQASFCGGVSRRPKWADVCRGKSQQGCATGTAVLLHVVGGLLVPRIHVHAQPSARPVARRPSFPVSFRRRRLPPCQCQCVRSWSRVHTWCLAAAAPVDRLLFTSPPVLYAAYASACVCVRSLFRLST